MWNSGFSPHPFDEPFEVDLTGVKVLAVDDEADSREVIRAILEARHATVQTARSVGEAIAMFADAPPHVVLSDIGMRRTFTATMSYCCTCVACRAMNPTSPWHSPRWRAPKTGPAPCAPGSSAT